MTVVLGEGDLHYFKQGAWRKVGEFTPLQLTPVLWLDAADLSTITASGSPSAVSQWDDKSGNNYDVTQATAALQPTTGATTINGLNVLDFNLDFLYRDQQLFTTAMTGYVVVSFNNTTSRYAAVDFGNITPSNRSQCIEQNTYLSAGNRYGFYSSSTAFDSATATSAGVKVIGVRATVTGTVVANTDYRVNGQSSALTITSGSGNYADYSVVTGFGVGAFNNNGSPIARLVGSIGEVIAFDRKLNLSETYLLESYLFDKWGL